MKPMAVLVKYFSIFRDITGRDYEDVSIDSGISVGVLLEKIKAKYPEIKKYEVIVSVNKQYATATDTVNDGDEVAIIPPLGGG